MHYLVHSVATRPDQVRSINDFIAGEVKAHEGLFTGFGTLHPDSEDLKEDLDHLVELGLKGVKLHPDFQGFAMNGKRAEKLGELISGKNIPVLVHCGDPRYNFSNPEQMKPFLQKFPDLTVIGAHFAGWSMWDDAMKLLADAPNLMLDTCSSLMFMDRGMGEKLVRTFGADRIFWATDYPMWCGQEELERFMALDLTDEERDKILYKNAAKFLGIEE